MLMRHGQHTLKPGNLKGAEKDGIKPVVTRKQSHSSLARSFQKPWACQLSAMLSELHQTPTRKGCLFTLHSLLLWEWLGSWRNGGQSQVYLSPFHSAWQPSAPNPMKNQKKRIQLWITGDSSPEGLARSLCLQTTATFSRCFPQEWTINSTACAAHLLF